MSPDVFCIPGCYWCVFFDLTIISVGGCAMRPPEHRLDIRRLPKAHKTPHVSRRFSYISSVVRRHASQGRREGPYITPIVTCFWCRSAASNPPGDIAKPEEGQGLELGNAGLLRNVSLCRHGIGRGAPVTPFFGSALATLAFASWPMNTKTKLPRTRERKMWQLPVSALGLPPR